MTKLDIQKEVKPLVDDYMSELINFFKNNSNLPSSVLLEKWHNFREKDRNWIVAEVVFTCIAKQNVDLNNIKKEDYKKVYPIIIDYPKEIEKIIDQNYYEYIHKEINKDLFR